MVLWQGMKLVATGTGIGLLASFALTRLIKNLLFNVSITDPITFVIGSLILTTVALIACFVPAHRAANTDPMIALRYE
jgi:putative ABC transport system permease protein